MNRTAVVALTAATLVAGLLVGAALMRSTNNPNFPKTTITLSPNPDQPGRCRAYTETRVLRAKRTVPVQWHLRGECSLAAGGAVQIRFTVEPGPALPIRPTQNGSAAVVNAWTTSDAASGTHRYKVWADFPDDANDYEMEDPDLEIVTFGFLRSLLTFW
jgi:hypothetical protein